VLCSRRLGGPRTPPPATIGANMSNSKAGATSASAQPPAPLRHSEHSAFRSFVRTPALARTLSTSTAAASPQPKNALQPAVGSLLNDLQRLQLDDPATAAAAAAASTAAELAKAQGAAADSSGALPPLALEPSAASNPAVSAPVDGTLDRSDKPLHRCTLDLLPLFRKCNPAYSWSGQQQPRRVLTSPSQPSATNPHDNINSNLIMSVGDILWHNTEDTHVSLNKPPPVPKSKTEGLPPQRYEKSFRVLELLGEGTFGQVVKVEECLTIVPAVPAVSTQQPNVPTSSGSKHKLYRAVKVVKSKSAYYNQALMEIQILRILNERYDPNNEHHLLRMIETFNCKGHLCFPESDTRVLTSRGFFFLQQIEAYNARLEQGQEQEPLLYACFDVKSQALMYRPGRVVFGKLPERWVDFTDAAEQSSWDHGDDGGAADAHSRSNRVSLRVTPEHTMYAQVGRTGDSFAQNGGAEVPYRAVPAKELTPGFQCTCPPEHKLHDSGVRQVTHGKECLHGYEQTRFLAHAPAGVTADSWPSAYGRPLHSTSASNSLDDSPISQLGLTTEDQLDAFLTLYGYWLGAGSLSDGAERGVHFSSTTDAHLLPALLSRAGLAGQWRQSQRGDIVSFVITDARWFAYFEGTFGRRALSRAGAANDDERERRLCSWVLRRLDCRQLRLILDGLCAADGFSSPKQSERVIYTDSASLRDSLLQLCLQAGYSAYFRAQAKSEARAASSRGGWAVCFDDLNSAATRPVVAAADTRYDGARPQSRPSAKSDAECLYDAVRDGRAWCINVEHPDHLIVAQRTQLTAAGDVVKASRPLVVGNCLVFELLSVNLYELMKQNGYRGLSWSLLRMFLKQLLDALSVLQRAKIIHCDLKPENVLLNKLTSPDITLIDFGSACFEYQTVYSYIQSRFYRSPEVLVGLPYNSTIDLWSFGCIAAELYLGLPLFPGITQHNQMQRIIKFIGGPPSAMLDKGKNTKKFFKVDASQPGSPRYTLKTAEEYAADTRTEVGIHKTYFKGSTLKEVVDLYPMRRGLNDAQKAQELEDRRSFLHFLQGFLRWDAAARWTPQMALRHPFLQRQPLSGFDEATFEKLRFVVDQPLNVPPAMPPAGKQIAAPVAAPVAAASTPAVPASAVSATAGGTQQASASGTRSTPQSPNKNVSSGGQLLSQQELAARAQQHQQQQMQQQQQLAQLQQQQQALADSGMRSASFSGTLLPGQQQPAAFVAGAGSASLSQMFLQQQQLQQQLLQQQLGMGSSALPYGAAQQPYGAAQQQRTGASAGAQQPYVASSAQPLQQQFTPQYGSSGAAAPSSQADAARFRSASFSSGVPPQQAAAIAYQQASQSQQQSQQQRRS